MLAGVDDTDGVDGGVFMPPSPRDPFGELLFKAATGDGILYLKRRQKRSGGVNHLRQCGGGGANCIVRQKLHINLPAMFQWNSIGVHRFPLLCQMIDATCAREYARSRIITAA